MRELKFRAWDVEAKCYIKDPILVDNFGNVYVVYEEPSPVQGTCLITGKPNVILERNTGLEDKNGKEMCEGDIVRFKWTKRLYVVTYREYDASFILENDEWEETIHLSLDKDDFEVFGNIHENPELLEDEK